MNELGIDLGTVGVLAALIVLEGGRKVPSGSLLLRRTLLGPWIVVDAPSDGRRWRFVSWFPPFVTTVVIPPKEPDATGREAGARSECPRCGAVFVIEAGDCSDCRIPLARCPAERADGA